MLFFFILKTIFNTQSRIDGSNLYQDTFRGVLKTHPENVEINTLKHVLPMQNDPVVRHYVIRTVGNPTLNK